MIFVVLWVGFAIASGIVAGNQGRNAIGWGLLGLVLGIIPLIILLCIGPPDNSPATATRSLPPSGANPAEELAKWKALHESGVITESEFEMKKQKLLAD